MSELPPSNVRPEIRIIPATAQQNISLPEIKNLLFQLTLHPVSFSNDDLRMILSSQVCDLFLALDPLYEDKIIGMVSVIRFHIPTGLHSRIEDLVVDQAYRGKGIGKKLMQTAIDSAKKSGVVQIELTSNARRVAANHLYQKLGFQSVHTNVYRLYL